MTSPRAPEFFQPLTPNSLLDKQVQKWEKKIKVRLLNVISAQLSEEISRECQNLLSYATLE